MLISLLVPGRRANKLEEALGQLKAEGVHGRFRCWANEICRLGLTGFLWLQRVGFMLFRETCGSTRAWPRQLMISLHAGADLISWSTMQQETSCVRLKISRPTASRPVSATQLIVESKCLSDQHNALTQ